MIPKFIRSAIIKAIKKRVLKRTQQFGDYEKATSFIINAPIKEWRSRLWLIENVDDGTGFCCTDENYISGLFAIKDSLNLFNAAINSYGLHFVVLTHCIEENHRVSI